MLVVCDSISECDDFECPHKTPHREGTVVVELDCGTQFHSKCSVALCRFLPDQRRTCSCVFEGDEEDIR